MSVFICWSGDRSKKLAHAVATLLRTTVPWLKEEGVFVSGELEKGTTWFESIIKELRQSEAGVVCLTAENLESPWLHFEAGALASHFATAVSGGEQAGTTSPPPVNYQRSRVFTLLHGVTVAELKGPLSAYQATSTTQQEMRTLVLCLANVLGEIDGKFDITEDAWKAFQQGLDKIEIPVRELISDLDSLFQHKTFYGPLYRCADQAWLDRYDRVRLTREKLSEYLERVRAACPVDERGLFEMLLAELDGFAMAMGSLLLETKKFRLGKPGELEMEEGIRMCCEDRRLAIRSLAGRLLHPLGSPRQKEAVRFMGAETNEERKMIVHRLEGTIRRKWEQMREPVSKITESFPSEGKQTVEKLESPEEAIDFRESSWDLDRIYYYLLIQYFRTDVLASGVGGDGSSPTENEFLCAARDVEMELERFWAKSKGGSLMPLTYALVALQALGPAHAGSKARSVITTALNLVKTDLKTVLNASDAGHPISRLLNQMTEQASAEVPASSPN
jgi:hypothetical protein